MSNYVEQYIKFCGDDLGSINFLKVDFPNEVYSELESNSFKNLSVLDKHEKVNRLLYEEIKNSKDGLFLLPKIVSYISRIRSLLHQYNLSSFEFWLNNYLEIDESKKMKIRGKIVGKWIPRDEYQKFFPIGERKIYNGSHYSCAHYAPDIDTTVASFNCYLSAFAVKIGSGMHYWQLPGGPPKESVEVEFLFYKAFGKDVFNILAKTSRKLSISALDLLTQKNIIKKNLTDLSYDIDHDRDKKSVILVNDNDLYVGDWRDIDVDKIRSIVSRFVLMLTEYQNHLHVGLVSLFASMSLSKLDVDRFVKEILNNRISDCRLGVEFSNQQRNHLDKFLKNVLNVPSGYWCTFNEFIDSQESMFEFLKLKEALCDLTHEDLYYENGEITEKREVIFSYLEKVLVVNGNVFKNFFHYVDSLKVALKIKQNVLGLDVHYLSHLSEYDEIVGEMGNYSHMTVIYKDNDDLYPLGVIHASDLTKKTLATSSWNDFSNPGESDSYQYVEVISFLDHHKSQISTSRPSTIVVSDAQSSNSILARFTMEINDKFSSGQLDLQSIDYQINNLLTKLNCQSNIRILQRLLQKKKALLEKSDYFVSYDREVLEYMQFLCAILDDTDLLTKTTNYDVEVVKDLLNKLKSLMLKQEVEIVNFDNMDCCDENYVQLASKKLLQTNELYSIYKIICAAKENATENLIKNTAKGGETSFFQDTKILGNTKASVGQIKLFANNRKSFAKRATEIRKIWVDRCKNIYEENSDIKLHIFMVSTISSADELFENLPCQSVYKDEIWLWICQEDRKGEHQLSSFVKDFVLSDKMVYQNIKILFGEKSSIYKKIFKESIHRCYDEEVIKSEPNMTIIFIDQKSITSRKSDISPFL